VKKLFEMISEQQKGHENSPVFMVGEQLKEIALSEPICAELLEKDLAIPEMSLVNAEEKLKAYADANHKGAKSFCISPMKAEEILREFYRLPKRAGMPTETLAEKVEASNPGHIDLSDFL
jgi:hypothetical protein